MYKLGNYICLFHNFLGNIINVVASYFNLYLEIEINNNLIGGNLEWQNGISI